MTKWPGYGAFLLLYSLPEVTRKLGREAVSEYPRQAKSQASWAMGNDHVISDIPAQPWCLCYLSNEVEGWEFFLIIWCPLFSVLSLPDVHIINDGMIAIVKGMTGFLSTSPISIKTVNLTYAFPVTYKSYSDHISSHFPAIPLSAQFHHLKYIKCNSWAGR